MARVFRENAISLLGEEHFASAGHRAGSTDMGDLSHVMPVVHPYMGGAAGSHHGADFAIADPVLAYVAHAKALALTAVDLLWDGGARARDIIRSSKPKMTKEEYLKFQRGLQRRELFDGDVR